MTEDKNVKKKSQKALDREARMKAALKANMSRRKAQTRARNAVSASDTGTNKEG
ncbi:MAG: hypothetical protein ACPGVK_06485 [Halocynthiibacter sp.]